MTTLLALDASTTAVGWAVFQDGDYLRSGVYLPKGKVWWERVAAFDDWLYGMYSMFPLRPPVLAYEIATGRHGNVHTDRVLGAVEYVARRQAAFHEREFVAVTASQVRATECHKKNLPYAVAIKGAPLDKKHAGDEADAIGVGLAALKRLKEAEWEAMGCA